ncbi:sterile alpha motif domain-containing protein 9-like [Anneissia japonica]|uniref:sterile alpha motif domain-containing protein 9-like n=1 Tax=Anneissia japonica TaxID=1529436 RepID=UPI0014258F4A|nr:sterile alpha motif domain-containing protein 9-like [Anneissia japonica]XP_033110346.1 sterile alpha motif domain-containing protein 9-like [Anneissia japonica]
MMSNDETDVSPELEVQTTPSGNNVKWHQGLVSVEGNNNIVVINSQDINVGLQKRHGSDEAKEQVKKKDIRRRLLNFALNYDENCDNLSDEQTELLLQRLSDLESVFRKLGPNLRSISCGSLNFCLSVHDSYALKNLMESHKNGRLLRELAKILVTESEVEEFCQSWSTHIDEQMYETVLCKLKTFELSSKNMMAEWNRSQVREWLSVDLRLKDDIVNKFYEEEVIGKNLLFYEDDEIAKDFNLKKSAFRMIQYGLEKKRSDTLKVSNAVLKPVTDNCSIEMVFELLLQVGVTPIHAEKFKNMEISGFRFMRYRAEHFKEDLHLTTGPLRLVLHLQTLSQNAQKSSTDAKTIGMSVTSTPSEDIHLDKKPLELVESSFTLASKRQPLISSTASSTNSPQSPTAQLLTDDLEKDGEVVCDIGTKKKKSKKKKKKIKPAVACPSTSTFSEAEQRVRELLLGTSQLNVTFDTVYDAILVVNDPDEELRKDLDESFDFISKVRWKGVFDFDAFSNESGICKVVRSKRSIKMYFPKDVSNVKLPSEISYSEMPVWIFSNGRTDSDIEAMDRMTWIEKRSHDMDNAIEFFSNVSVVRQGTGLIILILLSANIEVLSEAFRKFYTNFGINRVVFICESTQVFETWCKLVSWYCKPEALPDRAIIGVPWKSLNDIIMRMQGVNVKSNYTLPTVNGSECQLWERDKSRWLDLSVVTYNECENTDMDENHPDFVNFCREKELEFYRGEKLTFWNFKLTDMGYDHVCQRDIKKEIIKAVEHTVHEAKSLHHSVIQWIHLYHQPGAGGSTVVRHVLWEFRRKYRCVILNKITDQTESQIKDMWQYGEGDGKDFRQCLPLVIVSDNLRYEDLTDMVISLEYNTKYIPARACIILNCRRNLSQMEMKKEVPVSHSHFILEHSLSRNEKAWFQHKHEQLEERKDRDFTPDRLLAFMVMKEEFQSSYVKKVVDRVLIDLKKEHPNEFELVKYCALFSKFERDSAIPIPCCDELMGYSFSVPKGRNCPWEYNRSEGSSILMVTVDIYEVGSVQGFKIVHPTVADFILKNITTSEPLNLVVKMYLKSVLLNSKSRSREYLIARTHDLLIKRNRKGYDSADKQKFSALILEIKSVDKQAACKVLTLGFQVLQDSRIAQQIARYYNLAIEDFPMALEFIEKAIDMKKDNSFYWDTKGQIYRKEIIKSFYHTYVVEDKILSFKSSFELLKLAFSGIETFQMSQRLSLVDRKDNTSSFSGEVDMTFKLLDVLTCLDVFKCSSDGRKMLQRYLIDQHFLPDELVEWTDYHQKMKSLMRNVHGAIDAMTNFLTFQKEWSNYTLIDDSTLKDLKVKIRLYLVMWENHFGSIDIQDVNMFGAETANDLRRIKARKLGAHSLAKIFDKAVEDDIGSLMKIRKLLLKNEPYNAYDMKYIILANLALSVSPNRNKQQYDLPPMKDMINLAKEFDQCDRKEKDFSLYPPLFLLMLLWPRGQPLQEYDNKLMKKSLKEISVRWRESQKQNWVDENYSSQHALYVRHSKSQRSRSKPVVHFFLGSGKGLKALVHYSRITSNAKRLERDREQIWETPVVRENLLKVEGMLSDNNTIIYKHKYTDEPIKIFLASSSGTLTSREEVVFYIGFSWGGPVAYYVKPKNMSEVTESAVVKSLGGWNSSPPAMRAVRKSVPVISVPEYQKKLTNLKKKLSEINDLKEKVRRGNTLEKNQQMKVNREDELRRQQKELEDEFKMQLEMETTLGE